jgi:type 1 glutamine amidotransferase
MKHSHGSQTRWALAVWALTSALACASAEPASPDPGTPEPGAGGASAGGSGAPGATGGAGGKGTTTPPPVLDAGAPVQELPDASASPADREPGRDTAAPQEAGAPPAADASGSARPPAVFVFTRTTGFRHDDIDTAAMSLREALTGMGVSVDVGADPRVFTATGLARYGAVILLSTTGKPLGDPGTEAIAALVAFVRAGGGLVGLHAASSTEYDPAQPYTPLIGGKFVDHPGSVRMSSCHPQGMHPSVVKLPSPFPVRDEIYVFERFRDDNQIDMRCDAVGGGATLPIAWHRQEGEGRVFYTALGHGPEMWAASARFLKDHVIPGVLWTLGR